MADETRIFYYLSVFCAVSLLRKLIQYNLRFEY